jgi:Flp pilus assembly protein CpaB
MSAQTIILIMAMVMATLASWAGHEAWKKERAKRKGGNNNGK